MNPVRVLAAGIFCLLLFASPAFATSGHVQQSQSLTLTMQGMIADAGSQHYSFSGGKIAAGSVNGQDVSSAQVRFSLEAGVHGAQDASGSGSLVISTAEENGDQGGQGDNLGNSAAPNDGTGGDGSHGDHGDHHNGVFYSADISITGVIQAAIFPLTITSATTYNNCDPTSSTACTSEIPLFFTGVATPDSHGEQDRTGGNDPVQVPIAIESPYWNPFGGAILITSLESATSPSIYLIVHYDSATIHWSGVRLQGAVTTGLLGSESITSGFYGQSVNSHENLMKGTESDRGSIAFTGMSDPVLDASGKFSGETTFTLAGSFDCSSLFAFPGIPPLPSSPVPTCTATGATSNGSFTMNGAKDVVIGGAYATGWSVPSLFTQTIVVGAVAQH